MHSPDDDPSRQCIQSRERSGEFMVFAQPRPNADIVAGHRLAILSLASSSDALGIDYRAGLGGQCGKDCNYATHDRGDNIGRTDSLDADACSRGVA